MIAPESVLTSTKSTEDTLRFAVRELRRLRSELEEHRQTAANGGANRIASPVPIEVLGAGCRLPGSVDSPEMYWQALVDGRCLVSDGPPDRWLADSYYSPAPGTPGRAYTTSGGYLDDITGFDADLFRIPPREAVEMDPQHRLVLEVAWEALEHAGIAPDSLRGSATGVYIGISGSDYERVRLGEGDPNASNSHSATGTASNFAANRLSYALDLRGPSVVVDTACSSSLVAVHLAMAALRSGECDTALVGGVNLLVSPSTTVALCQGRMLSPSGRCHTFDERADGYTRGEGCAVLVLRRTDDVDPAASRSLGRLLGSAVNQDGNSSGITVPNGASQQAVIERALLNAHIEPARVGYVEAHGTGTALGDPIEIQALAAVYGVGRSAGAPLMLGSAKANFGHLEAAAGIAGLLKALLVAGNGVVPPHPDLRTPNRRIPWDSIPVALNRSAVAWDIGDRIAGVSAFGFGGTNCHLLVANSSVIATDTKPSAVSTDGFMPQVADPVHHILKISAATERSLVANAAALADRIEAGPVDLRALSRAATVGRADLEHRAVAVGGDAGELVVRLREIAAGGGRRGRRRGGADPTLAFRLPSGDGWRNLGREDFQPLPGGSDLYPTGIDTAVDQPGGAQDRDGRAVHAIASWWQAGGLDPHVVESDGGDVHLAAVVAGSIGIGEGLVMASHLAAERSLDGFDLAPPRSQIIWNGNGDGGAASLMSRLGASSTDEQPCDVTLDLRVPAGRTLIEHLYEGLVDYWLAGGSVDWSQCLPAADFVDIPTYSWDRACLWYRDPSVKVGATHVGLQVDVAPSGAEGAVGTVDIDAVRCPVVAEHTVYGLPVVPGVVYLEAMLRTAEAAFGHSVVPGRLVIKRPLVVRPGDSARLSVELSGVQDGRSDARVVTVEPDGRRRVHLEAELVEAPADSLAMTPDVDAEGGTIVGPAAPDTEFYLDRWHPQFRLGPSFTLVTETQMTDDRVTGRLMMPDPDCAGSRTGIRTELLVLDACVQLAGALAGVGDVNGPVYLGTGYNGFQRTMTAELPPTMTATATRSLSGSGIDVRVESESGVHLATLFDIGYGPVDEAMLRRLTADRPGSVVGALPPEPSARVRHLVASVLATSIDKLDDELPLSDMMDSLLFVELAEALSEAFERSFDEHDLLEAATVSGLIGLVTGGSSGAASPVGPTSERTAERRRRRLMDVPAMAARAEIELHVMPPQPAGQAPADILVTGATGFVGAFLLEQLLVATDAGVLCLVRAEDPEHGWRRLVESTSSLGVDLSAHRHRIEIVVGDLSQPRFGLDAAAFAALHARIGHIVHNGAEVKWTSNYERLAPANVDGTRHVLELATVGPARPVHFTSTVGVFSSGDVVHDRVDEQTDLATSGPLIVGYAQTKWVAEQMIRNAGTLGVPFTIHRINTGPHSRTGAFNRLDHLSLILKGCIEAGIAPVSGRFPLQAAPIDFVAATMVRLSLDKRFHGRTFHLVSNPPMPWSELFAHVEQYGYRFHHMPFDEWRHQITKRESGTLALLGLAPFMNDLLDDVHLADFDAPETDTALDTVAMACPPLDRKRVHTFIDGFRSREFIPDPDESPHHRDQRDTDRQDEEAI